MNRITVFATVGVLLLLLPATTIISSSEPTLISKINHPTPQYIGELQLDKQQNSQQKDSQLQAGITDLTSDSSGNVYVNDRENHRIIKYDSFGKVLFEIEGEQADNNSLYYPEAITTDSQENLYIGSDSSISKFDSNGNLVLKFGTYCELYNERYPAGGPSQGCVDPDGDGPREIGDGQFADIVSIVVDRLDNLLVADLTNDRIQKFSSDGIFISKFGISGNEDGQLEEPISVELDSAGYVYVGTNDGKLQKFNTNGEYMKRIGSWGYEEGKFVSPDVIRTDGNHIYVLDSYSNTIQKFDLDGNFITNLDDLKSNDGKIPHGFVIKSGKFYLFDQNDSKIRMFEN